MSRALARKVRSICTVVAFASLAVAQNSTTRISVDAGGAQANGYSASPAISADGRLCVFESTASNLVAGDTNDCNDIFLRDRQLSTTRRVSVSTSGVEGNMPSFRACISANGRWIAFDSSAKTLVPGDNNHALDVFLVDAQTNTTLRISVDSFGTQGNSNSTSPSISGTGRYVAFTSSASNLIAVDTNSSDDVFLYDRQTAHTTRVSFSSGGSEGNGWSGAPSISEDGRYVAFESIATNLVAGDTNGTNDVFVRDLAANTTVRASVGAAGAQGNDSSFLASVTANGRYVLFASNASNLVTGDTNNVSDIFVRDLVASTTTRVSTAAGGGQANGASERASMSGDGRVLVFESTASNLVSGDTNNNEDVFLRDLQSSAIARVSVDTNGAEGNGSCTFAAVSRDGRFIAFQSTSTNLVAGDTNGSPDVFVRDRGYQAPVVFCTAGTSTNNCVAAISANGTPSASSASGFTVSVAQLDGQRQAILFYGLDNSGFTPAPWGASEGYLCIKHPTQRTGMHNTGGTSGACNGTYALDWNAYRASHPSSLGSPFLPGQHVYAQVWFRDPPSPKTTLLTNAIEFVVQP